MTILEVLQAATGYLAQNGIDSPRLNAEHLLAHTLGLRRLDLYLAFDRPLSEAERAPLRDLIRKRAQGIPLQHLLGSTEFFGREFACDARALIPRPETEQLVELVLPLNSQPPCPQPRDAGGSTLNHLLDIGTGSGVIAVTLALEFPGAFVHATDLSPGALALAHENAARHGVSERITFHEADLLPAGNERFDLLVANLPYIPTAELAALQREVQHDPPSALDGGPDGLDLIRRLVAAAPERLVPSGTLCLEIGHGQAAAVAALFSSPPWRPPRVEKDFQGAERFVLASVAA